MKEYWIIFIILLLLPSSTYASTIKQYGVKIGLTSANQEFTDVWWKDGDSKRKNGFNGGIFIEFFDNLNFTILTQLEYTQKGMIEENHATDENGNDLGTFKIESTLNYLSFPVSAKYTIPIPKIVPYLIAGLRYDYLLNYESIIDAPGLQVGSETSGPQVLENTIYDDFKRSVFGAQFGIGLEIDILSFVNPWLEFRYNIDLTNSLNLDGKNAKNNSFDISLFIPIDL